MPPPMPKVATDTPVKAGLRNNDRSNMGRGWRSSTTTNVTSRKPDAASVDRMRTLVHPSSLPRVSPSTSKNRLPDSVNSPPPVETLGVGVPDVDHTQRQSEGDHPDGNVHVEDPLPPEAARERPAHEGPDGHRAPDRRPPGGDGGGARLALEVLGDERQRGGEHGGPAHALHGTGGDEVGRRRGQATAQRGQGEHEQPEDEDPLASEPVRQRALGEDQRGQADGVGGDHPLQIVEGCVQGPLDRGQRHLDDGDVDEEHEGAAAHRDQGQPLPPATPRAGWAGPSGRSPRGQLSPPTGRSPPEPDRNSNRESPSGRLPV